MRKKFIAAQCGTLKSSISISVPTHCCHKFACVLLSVPLLSLVASERPWLAFVRVTHVCVPVCLVVSTRLQFFFFFWLKPNNVTVLLSGWGGGACSSNLMQFCQLENGRNKFEAEKEKNIRQQLHSVSQQAGYDFFFFIIYNLKIWFIQIYLSWFCTLFFSPAFIESHCTDSACFKNHFSL